MKHRRIIWLTFNKKNYFNKLPELVDEYKSTISMKSDDFKANIYIYIYTYQFGVEFNIKKSKFKVSNHGRISKYKNSFVNGYQSSQIDEMFVI